MSVFDFDQFANTNAGVLVDRAIKSAMQGAVLAVGVESTEANALEFDFELMAGMAAGGLLLSLMTNLGQKGILNLHKRRRSGSDPFEH